MNKKKICNIMRQEKLLKRRKKKRKRRETSCREDTFCQLRISAGWLRTRPTPSGRPHLLSALSISMTTSTDRAMVMGLGWLKTSQSIPANISSWAKHWAWCVCGREGVKATAHQGAPCAVQGCHSPLPPGEGRGRIRREEGWGKRLSPQPHKHTITNSLEDNYGQ